MHLRISHYTVMRPYLQKDGLDLPTVLPRCILPSGGVQNLMRGNACIGQSFLPPDHPDDNVRHAVLRLVTWVGGKRSKASISLNAHGLAGWTCRAPLGKETLWPGVVWPTFPSLTSLGPHWEPTGLGRLWMAREHRGKQKGLHLPKAPCSLGSHRRFRKYASYLVRHMKKAANNSQRITNSIYFPI